MSTADRSAFSSRRLLLIGVAAVALFFAVAAGSSLAPLGDAIALVVEQMGHDYVIAAALGVGAVVAGVGVFASGRGTTMRQVEMPTVERPVPVPSAGEPFDETIGTLRFATRSFGGARSDAVRYRLRAAAVAAIVVDEGCSRGDAHRRIDDGIWTDDADAAAFLAGTYTPLRTWLVALGRGETGPEYRARRTVAAIIGRRERDSANGEKLTGTQGPPGGEELTDSRKSTRDEAPAGDAEKRPAAEVRIDE